MEQALLLLRAVMVGRRYLSMRGQLAWWYVITLLPCSKRSLQLSSIKFYLARVHMSLWLSHRCTLSNFRRPKKIVDTHHTTQLAALSELLCTFRMAGL